MLSFLEHYLMLVTRLSLKITNFQYCFSVKHRVPFQHIAHSAVPVAFPPARTQQLPVSAISLVSSVVVFEDFPDFEKR